MKIPSLKHRKPPVYVMLSIYVFLLVFIIFESSLSSSLSSVQSRFFTNISAWFYNLIHGPKIIEVIDPTSIGDVTDSTYFGQDEEGVSNIVIGTTSLVSINVKYPEKKKKDSTLNKEYTINSVLGNKNDYSTIISSSEGANDFNIYLRIVGNKLSDDVHQIDVALANDVTYSYKFKIIEKQAPINYQLSLDKTELKIGESASINIKLLDDSKNDYYLRRLFDTSKMDFSSSNDGVATIDSNGVIKAIDKGNAVINYGNQSFNVTVTNDSIVNPAGNELLLSLDATTNSYPSLLDYDYVFENNENPNEYSSLYVASFLDDTLEDQDVTWTLSDYQKAILAPYKYDENGFPIYHNDLGQPCVRVCGYRQKGEVTLKATSNVDPSLNKEIVLNVQEALPTSMKVNIKTDGEFLVNQQRTISASFDPKNVNNRAIKVEVDKEDIIGISNNNSNSVTITAKTKGKAHIKVTSLANSELTYEVDLEVAVTEAINEDNYESFHTFMRKAAGHFTLFLITAIFGYLFFYFYVDDYKKHFFGVLVSLGIGLFVASLTEFIQYFIPTRHGTIVDVGTDFVGYIIGTAIPLLIILLVRFIRKKKNASKGDSNNLEV
ncbi:MAG: VanZ family protein [Bacilli bacterium]|nr:VanZ family protein [Bacilli bacterium]